MPSFWRQLAIAFTTALLVAPALARGITLHDFPLPRPAPAALRNPQATPGAQVAPASRNTPQPEANAAARGAPSMRAGPKPLNMVRSAPEELGQVPDHFFWLRQGLQAAQDPLDGDLVFITDDGHIAGRAALPPGFVIGKVVTDDGQIRLLDPAGRLQVSIARNIDASSVKSLQALPVMANMGRQVDVTRAGPRELILRDQRRSGARSLEVRALTAGSLAQARAIGAETTSNRYVVSEEIVAVVPSLQVRVLVRRYDRAGNLTGVVNVPLDGFDVVPHDFVAIDGRGRVRALVPTANGVTIREYEFSAPPARQRGGVGAGQIRSMGRAIHEFGVKTNVQGEFEPRRTFRKSGARFEVKTATSSISREQVVKNAEAYLTVDWVMERENFSHPFIENRCSPQEAEFWKRPSQFTSASIGKTIGPMPYRWGGDDTPQTFKARIDIGALAGDVCTCRSPALDYCLAPESAGVDCSGFVSRAWGIGKRGTAGLLDVATELKSIADLRPGDAFDWPGHHVRLFVRMAPSPEVGFTVLEASTRHDCQGVCERTYRPSEMNGFQLIRYEGISG